MRHNQLPTLLIPILLAAALLPSAFAFLRFGAQVVRSNPQPFDGLALSSFHSPGYSLRSKA